MSGGILGGLFEPGGAGTGLLGGFHNMVQENGDSMMGMGLGLMAGDMGQASQGYMQGQRQDTLRRQQKLLQDQELQKRTAAQSLVQKYNIPPELATDPDTVLAMARSIETQKRTPKEVSFEERQFNQLNPEQQGQYRQQKFLGGEAVNWRQGTTKNPDGSESSYFYNPRNPSQTMPTPGGGGQQAAGAPNPYIPQGGGTVDQNNAAMFARRASQAHSILNDTEDSLTSQSDTLAANTPWVGNRLVSGQRQQAEQAKLNFVTAVLRKESGASISPTEFETAEKVYFPQPGDTKETINQKRTARISAVKGLMGSSPKGYRPEPGWEDPATAGQKQPSVAAQVGASAAQAIKSGTYNYDPNNGLVPAQ